MNDLIRALVRITEQEFVDEQTYREIFNLKGGEAILGELLRVYWIPTTVDADIRSTEYKEGQKSVVTFILNKIISANTITTEGEDE